MVEYFSIEGETNGFFKDRGSKFHAFAFPVWSEDEIKTRLMALRKEYHDARHHCYAYSLGMEQVAIRANDDGEPNHSAGDPILGQIRSFGLTNVLVVVIRYFGGTKLGVGGLIHAYKMAANEALSKAVKKEIFPLVSFTLTYDYDQTSQAEQLLSAFVLHDVTRDFGTNCQVLASIRKEDFQKLKRSNEPHWGLRLSEPADVASK